MVYNFFLHTVYLYCCNTPIPYFEKKKEKWDHLKNIFQTASKQLYVAIVLNVSKHMRFNQRVKWLTNNAYEYKQTKQKKATSTNSKEDLMVACLQ